MDSTPSEGGNVIACGIGYGWADPLSKTLSLRLGLEMDYIRLNYTSP